ncbi:hypothetical protein BDD43_1887 [Mucilaginibacter gracilis]|uniref:GLPGLI family protein n=1 Tax=Mucilaginibacter gracilis TaxID=423350 RepID=A0A495IYD8_9SPHI|nr:hypothetical protein [Mucilaginibacter gracilis]RKR81736.1 hypothetical protein BDD43_1887 [Mucilaginibacter gracilis]
MKKIYFVFLLSLFITSRVILAQAQVPVAYRPDFNRMMSAQAMQFQQMSMQRMMNMRWNYGMDYLANNKYDYKVTMKDNSVMIITSKIYVDTTTHKSYLAYKDKSLKRSDPKREKRIYADQTLKISREEVNFLDKFDVNGISTDSCWLFKVAKGKINIYSHLSEVLQLNNMYLRAFQVGDGPIQKVDSASLLTVIKDNPKAMKAFKKKDYYKAINKFNDDNK